MNIILLASYILLSTGGATLVKLGGNPKMPQLFTVPYFDFPVSFVTLLGVIGYSLSFLLFIVLLNKLELSYLTPVATGVSYALLMGASILVFNEGFSLIKTVGCILILVGVIMVVANGTKLA